MSQSNEIQSLKKMLLLTAWHVQYIIVNKKRKKVKKYEKTKKAGLNVI